MPNLSAKIEALLLYAVKPMKNKELLKATGASLNDFEQAVQVLKDKFNREDSGIHLLDHDQQLQFVTAPEQSELIQQVYAAEMTGDLTKPALETLTIIAYRGPITKPELELIRGINCSLILRNLMMRGLVTEAQGKEELLPVYQASPEFLQYLGMTHVNQLPEFEALSSNELLDELLKQRSQEPGNDTL